MALSDIDRVRAVLAERIPTDGDENDTMFPDDQIQDWIDVDGAGVVGNAVYLAGWKAKAAEYSNLVDVTEGNSSRSMSDLYKAALEMVAFYQKRVDRDEEIAAGGVGHVVIGKISRGSSYGTR